MPEKTRLVRSIERLAATRQGAWLVIHVMNPMDRYFMTRTHGRSRKPGKTPTKLLLHHVGAKTGQARHTPLMCIADDDHWIIAASKGGDTRHPAWYFNVTANPAVSIDLAGERIPVQARELHGDEYDKAWTRAKAQFAGFETYQARTGGRTIPLIRLDRRSSEPGAA